MSPKHCRRARQKYAKSEEIEKLVNQNVNPRNFKFCPLCSGYLKEKVVSPEQKKRLVCEDCSFIFYMNPIPAVAVLLQQEQQILLVKRKYEPKKGQWSLPAGFMEFNESAEQTAIRETKEETNIDIKITDLFGVFQGSYGCKISVLLIVFKADIIGGSLKAGDDAEEVCFFKLGMLPKDIAFSTHRKVFNILKKSFESNHR